MQKPSLSTQNSRRMLLTLCGGLNLYLLLIFLVFLVLSGVLVNFASDVLKDMLQSVKLPYSEVLPDWINTELVATLVLLIFFMLFLFSLRSAAKTALARDQLTVRVNPTPQVDVLVMFLSKLDQKPNDTQAEPQDPLQQQIKSLLKDRTVPLTPLDLENINKHPWRMNLAAIMHQLQQLPVQSKLDLVVIPSNNTEVYWPLFDELITKGFAGRVRLHSCSEFLGDNLFCNYADYENLQQLFAIFQKIQHKAYLRQPGSKVCFDATSGTKICSIACAMASLSEEQGLQYVSNDYKVKCYQLDYTKADE